MPATPVVVTPIFKFIAEERDRREEIKEYRFDKARLWFLLRRLEKQKYIETTTTDDGSVQVRFTEKGRTRHLKYKLEDMVDSFTKKVWDGKWRLIIFDVPEKFRCGRDNFRYFLKNMKFYQLQKSVYLTPYPCQDEIEYLRQYFGLGNQVQILVADHLENDVAYRLYFGLT